MIACDLIVAADPDVLSLLAPDAVAVANTYLTPTGDFPRVPNLDLSLHRQSRAVTARAQTIFADLSAIATQLLGDAVGANMMALGMAWQRGRIPLSEEAILRAVELNGVAISLNKAAFGWGRALANDPQLAVSLTEEPASDASLDAVVARREKHLINYQDERLARKYRAMIERVAAVEARIAPDSHSLTEAVARAYHKLLAIKDEYEVARLHTDADFLDGLSKISEGGRRVFHLAPPLLARRDPLTGHPRKMRVGPWIVPVFRVLAAMKALRGTPFDLFGRTGERKMERRLVVDYEGLVERLLNSVSKQNLDLATELAALPLEIRGFGHVKLDSVKRADRRRDELLASWSGVASRDRRSARDVSGVRASPPRDVMRSLLLFVPGDDARKLAKAPLSGADALVFDLEDAVALDRKLEARGLTVEHLAGGGSAQQSRWVRVNGLATGLTLQDLVAVMPVGPNGIVLPKCTGPTDVETLSQWLEAFEAAFGLEPKSTGIIGIATETASGVLGLSGFAGYRSERLKGLMWGAEDLSADIGGSARGDDGAYLSVPRLARDLCLLAANASGVLAIDAVNINFANKEALAQEAQEAARAGFGAKAAIHPSQVPTINLAFQPTERDITWARRVVAALSAGAGVAVVDGAMVDKAHLRRAQRIVDLVSAA